MGSIGGRFDEAQPATIRAVQMIVAVNPFM
jgi:hypothetical protein